MGASRLQLPPGPWARLVDGLCARFPGVPREQWLDRLAGGRVLDADGQPLAADAPYRAGSEVSYYREVADEPRIPARERIVHADAHLVVADKPHALAVTPAGRAVRETLLARLVRRLGNEALVPLHRIDRDTAGLVLFSADPRTRAAYQRLFPERRIRKTYHAAAAPLPGLAWPHVRRSHMAQGEPFFRMCELPGAANSETRIDVLSRNGSTWTYRLEPLTGRKHQLRVHMAALGAPILNDRLYPELRPGHDRPDDPPLQLLAAGLDFVDPLSGEARRFSSTFALGGGSGA